MGYRIYRDCTVLFFCVLLLPPVLAAQESEPKASEDDWYVSGQLQVGVFADSIYADPYLRAARTPVFGDYGGGDPDADNTCIPTDLDEDGNVLNCRPLLSDTPVFGGTLSGSRVRIGHRGEHHDVFAEGIMEGDREDPFVPRLYRLWAEYKSVSFGYGWSTFTDFQQDFYPHFIEYNGPVGVPYKRQFLIRLRLGEDYYLGFEEANNPVYRGFGLTDTENVPADNLNSHTVFTDPRVHVVDLNGEDKRIYKVGRRLRTRGVLPDFVFTYYRKRPDQDWFVSLVMRYVRLDNNAPLLFEEDEGLLQLRSDADDGGSTVPVPALKEELALNEALSGGLSVLSPGFHLGGRWHFLRDSAIQLAYIYNGGTYLRDNPNPSYIVVPTKVFQRGATDYKLAEVTSHSYVFGADFGKRYNLILSGTLTDEEHELALGGGATKSLHSLHFNYLHEVREGLNFIYEIGYLYHETFNGRNNAEYPRLRMQYGLVYHF